MIRRLLLVFLLCATSAHAHPPPLRSVTLGVDRVTIVGLTGTRTFLFTDLPGSQATIAQAETFINAWLTTNVTYCQMRVHVFQRSPLRVTIGSFNLGTAIPANWWEDAP